jgi:mannosyltransferase OCH1-like enzyme
MILRSFLTSMALDLPFREIIDQNGGDKRIQKIPPLVYQTWEEKRFGKRHAKSIEKFRQRNRDLDFHLFDRSERDEYMEREWKSTKIQELYTRARFGALRADIFRYCIIFQRGGYYFDISKGLDCSLTSLHSPEAEGVITYESNPALDLDSSGLLKQPRHLVNQWGFGFVQDHELLRLHIESIEKNAGDYLNKIFPNPKLAILNLTGPRAFTQTVRDFAKSQGIAGLEELGIDFYGHGIYSLHGAGARFLVSRSYAHAKNQPIFN